MQAPLLAIEWALFAVFTADLVVKVYLREARIAYLLSFDGIAGMASIAPIVELHAQASIGFLRVLRVYRLARKVGWLGAVYFPLGAHVWLSLGMHRAQCALTQSSEGMDGARHCLCRSPRTRSEWDTHNDSDRGPDGVPHRESEVVGGGGSQLAPIT
jgi:hypothetical protein